MFPVSPVLAGRLFTIVLPGDSYSWNNFLCFQSKGDASIPRFSPPASTSSCYLISGLFAPSHQSHPFQSLLDNIPLHLLSSTLCDLGLPQWLSNKEFAGNAVDLSLIPGSGRSPGGHSNPLQYSCLENLLQRSLAGYSPWGCEESGTTEVTEHIHTCDPPSPRV